MKETAFLQYLSLLCEESGERSEPDRGLAE